MMRTILLCAMLLLAACSAPAATLEPSATSAPTMAAATAYPGPVVDSAYPAPDVAAEGAYPGPGAAVPIAPNGSLVTAELLEQRSDPLRANYVVLHVLLQNSEALEGERDILLASVGQEIDLYVPLELAPQLTAGQPFKAEVRVMGDENGQLAVVQRFVEP